MNNYKALTKIRPGQWVFFILLPMFFQPIFAQETAGEIQGVLIDSEKSPIVGAEIQVTGTKLIGILGTVSNKSGYFRIRAIPPGTYRVTIHHLSFQGIVFEDVGVLLGQTTSLGDIEMQSSTIEMEEVVFKWDRPAIDMTSTSLESYLDPNLFTTLPTQRDYVSLLTLLPQANVSYYGDNANIGGASGSDNVYYIDGINVTDPHYAKAGMIMPFNFIKGIEVKQGGYEAEYGKSLGGTVNIITSSGSNDFHANIFGYYTGDVLTSSEKADSILPRDIRSFSNYDFGFSLGGPIIKDKFWYYFAYNPIFENNDIKVPGYDTRKDSKMIHAYAAKLNWIALKNTRFTFSVLGNQLHHEQVGYTFYNEISGFEVRNIDAVLANIKDGSINLALDIKKNTRNGLFLSGNITFSNWNNDIRGQTEIGRTEPIYWDYVENYVSGGFDAKDQMKNQRINLKFTCAWEWKKHSFLAGIEPEVLRSDFNVFQNPALINRMDTNYWIDLVWILDGAVVNIVPATFIQDSWQVTNNFRLNYGLRWDAQFMSGPIKGRNINITDQIQPRIGFVYHPGDAGRLKFFSHYGRLYAEFPTWYLMDKIFPYDNHVFGYLTDPRNPGAIVVDTVNNVFPHNPAPIDPGKIKGEFSDEFIIGYEMKLPGNLKAGLKGTYRELKNALLNGYTHNGDSIYYMVVGNPGSGLLDFLPPAKRRYAALEISLGTSEIDRFNFSTSYVLSVNKGNYTGFYDQDFMEPIPGNNLGIQLAEQDSNSYGYLPNDHRHVFKANASYKFNFGLTAGTSFWIMSGAPLNEFGGTFFNWGRYAYLVKRGTAGRLPTIWDLNLRLTYDLLILSVNSKLFLDVLNVGNPRRAVQKDQVRFQLPDISDPNINYGNVLKYQPPMMVRVGLSVDL